MPEHRGAGGAAGPVVAGHVVASRECAAVGLRAGELSQVALSLGLICAAFAAFHIKVLNASLVANLIFSLGSLLMLAGAVLSLLH